MDYEALTAKVDKIDIEMMQDHDVQQALYSSLIVRKCLKGQGVLSADFKDLKMLPMKL